MTYLAEQISMACAALGIPVELGYTISVNDKKIRTLARIPDLGGPKGMLIVTSLDHLCACSEQLVELGYGFSVMSDGPERSDFDLSSWCEVFSDWGWFGDPAHKPKMMSEPPLDELKNALLRAENDEMKEDVAQKIATIHWETDESQEILFDAIHTGQFSGYVHEACISALANIWIRRGKINRRLYDQLDSVDLRQILAPWFEEVKEK